jgi:Lrp/AsnC family leucine-responsive transcriptional regulator
VKKHEENQIITGYAAKINLKALGLGIQTVIRIRTTHQYIQYYVEKFEKTNHVIDAVRVTGEDCFIVQCAFASTSELEKIVDDFAIHGSVSTSLVLSHPVSKSLKFN